MPKPLPPMNPILVGSITDQKTSTESDTKNCPWIPLTPINQTLHHVLGGRRRRRWGHVEFS